MFAVSELAASYCAAGDWTEHCMHFSLQSRDPSIAETISVMSPNDSAYSPSKSTKSEKPLEQTWMNLHDEIIYIFWT